MAKFSEVLTIVNGRNQKQVVCDDGKYPIYGSGGIMGYANDYICKAETVVIGRKGSINKPVFVETPFWNVDTAFGLCANSEKLNPKYLYYFCEKFDFEKLNTTVTIPSLTKSNLLNVEIPLPNLEKQKQIVELLDKVTSLIFLREQQLAKLDELVKARFVEMFGDPIRNEKGWNTYTLAEMCDGIGDGLHGTPEYDENGEYPFINGNNLISGIIQINPSTKKVNKKTYEKHYIKISQNAILLSINGTLGKIAFFNGEQVMLGKSACYCNLRDEVNRIFVYNIMKTDAFARYLEDNATKSTIKNVGLKAIREYRLIMPPIPLQNQFSSFVERVDQQKQTVQQSLEKLEFMKKALMQEYFG